MFTVLVFPLHHQPMDTDHVAIYITTLGDDGELKVSSQCGRLLIAHIGSDFCTSRSVNSLILTLLHAEGDINYALHNMRL